MWQNPPKKANVAIYERNGDDSETGSLIKIIMESKTFIPTIDEENERIAITIDIGYYIGDEPCSSLWDLRTGEMLYKITDSKILKDTKPLSLLGFNLLLTTIRAFEPPENETSMKLIDFKVKKIKLN